MYIISPMANDKSCSSEYVMEIDTDNIKESTEESTEESIERLRNMVAGEKVECRKLNKPMTRFEPKFNAEIKAVIDNYLYTPMEIIELSQKQQAQLSQQTQQAQQAQRAAKSIDESFSEMDLVD